MHEAVRWQVFNSNGTPLSGQSILPQDSRNDSSIIVGASHIWIWRKTVDGIEVLLQKRAKDKPTWADHLDISAAGHIDLNETPIEAAMRECEEEIGLTVDPIKLEFIFSYRNFDNGIKWIYIYEQSEPVEFVFSDGEVQSLEWVKFDTFEEMSHSPTVYKLVSHPNEYFSLVIKALKKLT